ncbi:biotin-requiring enzyme [Leptospira fainei serovar Hurstbridge str. BUT 6]|uniref:Biotin-requiring enzyme n=1 Tax=Leptospira fainei serovar Hurstbridge str. BUT 6 TaxID=1193011 RepID=S3VDX7_9LEPT|nr:biotin-requiring enzyme [Leptospira fainei serovar Hurstbridge str. BUT 6]
MGSEFVSTLYRLRWKEKEYLLDLGESPSSARVFDSESGWETLLSHYSWTQEKEGTFSLPDGSVALISGAKIFIHTRGRSFQFLLKAKETSGVDAAQKEIKSPMPGKLIKVEVKPGDSVKKGQVLAVVEAMKMEHALKAGADAEVQELKASPGDLVAQDQIILILNS